ncbi:hypothetical protein [Solitalea canadensis]|uniref:Uncharacterized protein n=1 Tax=Solitalea canadensis (strain ATCC 29591 / DSM 3403 / JCM 21819 / LMG 8368 / NBRC 15130 / NCIMB 12057 / USAM 9D) TaxID=929556 RepID=H8KRV6_SOLCM|nr:hypothetical protein [Solitalea canadensis]AFD07744.1 hypothetical protein Solca_2710 [Solitalea canadensis DSM 3403]
MKNTSRSQQNKSLQWVYITLGGFVVFMVFLILFILYNKSTSFNSKEYFILLVILSLIVTAFLSGAMRSYAKYTGNVYGGKLSIAGPIVVFIIMMFLGNHFSRNEKRLVINVFDENNNLLSGGQLDVLIGEQVYKEGISEKGQVIIAQIPDDLNKAIIRPRVVGYTFSGDSLVDVTGDKPIAIQLKKIPKGLKVHGQVQLPKGKSMENVRVYFDGNDSLYSVKSNGLFSHTIPFDDGDEVLVKIFYADSNIYQKHFRLSPLSSIDMYVK